MTDNKTEFCLSCGKRVSSADRFCNECSAPLKDVEVEDFPKSEPTKVQVVASDELVIQRTAEGIEQKIIPVKKKVLGRNAIILLAFATSFFVVPCFYVNLFGYAFALSSIIIGFIALAKKEQIKLAIISISISVLFSILSVLARAVWDLGYF